MSHVLSPNFRLVHETGQRLVTPQSEKHVKDAWGYSTPSQCSAQWLGGIAQLNACFLGKIPG